MVTVGAGWVIGTPTGSGAGTPDRQLGEVAVVERVEPGGVSPDEAGGPPSAQGQDYRQVFQHFRPGFDLAVERRRRADAGLAEHFNARDLYPDVRECLAALMADGYFVGVAGNQTARAGRLLRELSLGVDLIATSDDWGAEKPTPAFFAKLIESAGCAPAEIAYVGDRLDNDILPALNAGLTTVFIRRGPWGYYYATQPEVEKAHIRIDSLAELPEQLPKLNSEC
nr:HAD family hydrolase [Planosporangium thailandense]